MKSFFGGLALAAISGISWIAYAHPVGYKTISVWLYIMLASAWSWHITGKVYEIHMGITTLYNLVEAGNYHSGITDTFFRDTIHKLRTDFSRLGIIILAGLCVIAYLIFLRFLPAILVSG